MGFNGTLNNHAEYIFDIKDKEYVYRIANGMTGSTKKYVFKDELKLLKMNHKDFKYEKSTSKKLVKEIDGYMLKSFIKKIFNGGII
jgi:hypothetical protein